MRVVLVSCIASLLIGCGGEEAAGPIVFEDLRIEELSSDRAVARFTTSVPTECEIEYGIEISTMDLSAVDPDMEEGELAIDHNVAMEDLEAETMYFWRARATNADGVTEYSEALSFTTLSTDDPTAGLTNVATMAQGASIAEVSSNWGGSISGSFGANLLIDGMMSSEWSSAGDGDDAYVTVDLGQSRKLELVGYRSRKMSDGTSIVTSIEIMAGGNTYGPFSTPDPDQRYVFELDPPAQDDQVRLNVVTSSGGNTGGKELQLY